MSNMPLCCSFTPSKARDVCWCSPFVLETLPPPIDVDVDDKDDKDDKDDLANANCKELMALRMSPPDELVSVDIDELDIVMSSSAHITFRRLARRGASIGLRVYIAQCCRSS